MELLDGHPRQLAEQEADQALAPAFLMLGVIGELDDQFAQQGRDRNGAAPVGQSDQLRLDIHEEEPRIGGGAIAVRQAARNPDGAMGRRHPQAAGNAARDAAAEREHELSLAVPVVRDLRRRPFYVDPHRDDRRGPIVHIQLGPGVKKRQSHV